MLMSLHLSVASRLLLNSPQAFNEMVAAVAAEEGKAHAEVAGEEISSRACWSGKIRCGGLFGFAARVCGGSVPYVQYC